jgi:hypothetical protein
MASAVESHTHTNGAWASKQQFHMIWLADNIEELEKDHSQLFTNLQKLVTSFHTFSAIDLFVNYIFENNHAKILLIATGALGKKTIPIIHDAPQLDSVFVICHNKAYHEQWTKNWPKIKGLFNKIDVLCQAVEQAVQPPKPAIVLPKSPPTVRRSETPEPPKRTARRDRPIAYDDRQRESDEKHRRRGHSAMPIPVESRKIERKEPDVKKDAWAEPIPVIDRQHEKVRRRDSSTPPLMNSDVRRRTPTETPPDSKATSDELERTLIATTEQELRKSLLRTSINMNTLDQLQDTLVQTIERHVTKKKDDSNVLNHLFADLKQVLVDAIVQQQQQPVISQDVIKQAVLDAISEQKKSGANILTKTTNELTTQRRPITLATSREVKITADLKQTRVDAAFRHERDAVVANKRLRDAVQQWSSIKSIVDLATTIRTHGKNNLECAWLLFCWIGQNIQYRDHCNNNSAETVFRTRQGVCRGFVSLYHECCTLLNIECSEISGYAKQAFLKPGEELKQSPHAWNSIVLDQYTYLVDPTWGAGGRDNVNKLEDFYFLTSPEEFIYTHYCTGYQLLQSEISKEDFLSLPIMKSTYYRLGLTLLSPKQGLNEINQNLFKIAIRAPENVDLLVELKVNNTEYPRNLHTFCQRDETQSDVFNCYITPPLNGLYEIAIYAKTNIEKTYQDAINMRLRVFNMIDAFTFPSIYSTFTEHHCILIEPLQRLVYKNEEILIHMIIPHANVIKIQSGDDHIVPKKDEYKGSVLRKKVRVQGDLQICARWDDNADSISVICIFNMI